MASFWSGQSEEFCSVAWWSVSGVGSQSGLVADWLVKQARQSQKAISK